LRTEEGGVVISEQYSAPIKIEGGISERLSRPMPMIGRMVRLF